MIQIKEYDLSKLGNELNEEINKIDKKIVNDLRKISNINCTRPFFEKLNSIVEWENGFSFIKINLSVINQIQSIDTQIQINDIEPFLQELKKMPKGFCKEKITKNILSLNDILEFIFGYHIKERTQILKKIIRKTNFQNCTYCLAQFTTSYQSAKSLGRIYVKGNLDHIYPKSENALLSLSINNLVPVCAHCNQRKSDTLFVDFNPFKSDNEPFFKFDNVLAFENGQVRFNSLNNLKIVDGNNNKIDFVEKLELVQLYKEYHYPLENLLDRYKKFNSESYKAGINSIIGIDKSISDNLEYFISEVPFTEESLQKIPLQKFKSEFFKELEQCKSSGILKQQ